MSRFVFSPLNLLAKTQALKCVFGLYRVLCFVVISVAILSASLYAQEEQYILPEESYVRMNNFVESHNLSPITSRWTNCSFFEDSKVTARQYVYSYQWADGWLPMVWGWPQSQFYLVAKSITTGEYFTCSFELSDSRENDRWELTDNGSERVKPTKWVKSASIRGNLYSYCNTIEQEYRPERDFLFSHFNIIDTRGVLWQATVPEGDSLMLYFGTDLFGVSRKPQGMDAYIFGAGKENLGTIWNGWAEYFMDPLGKANGVWTEIGPVYIHDPQPEELVGELKFDDYYKRPLPG